MQGTQGTAVSRPSLGVTPPDEKPLQTISSSKEQLQQPAVLYIRGLVDVDKLKPVTVVFRHAAFVQQPEEPGE